MSSSNSGSDVVFNGINLVTMNPKGKESERNDAKRKAEGEIYPNLIGKFPRTISSIYNQPGVITSNPLNSIISNQQNGLSNAQEIMALINNLNMNDQGNATTSLNSECCKVVQDFGSPLSKILNHEGNGSSKILDLCHNIQLGSINPSLLNNEIMINNEQQSKDQQNKIEEQNPFIFDQRSIAQKGVHSINDLNTHNSHHQFSSQGSSTSNFGMNNSKSQEMVPDIDSNNSYFNYQCQLDNKDLNLLNDETKNNNTQLKQYIEKQKKQIEEQQKEIEKQKKQNEEQKKEIEKQKKQNEEQKKEIKEQQKEIKEQRKEIKDQQKELKEKQKKIDSLKNDSLSVINIKEMEHDNGNHNDIEQNNQNRNEENHKKPPFVFYKEESVKCGHAAFQINLFFSNIFKIGVRIFSKTGELLTEKNIPMNKKRSETVHFLTNDDNHKDKNICLSLYHNENDILYEIKFRLRQRKWIGRNEGISNDNSTYIFNNTECKVNYNNERGNHENDICVRNI